MPATESHLTTPRIPPLSALLEIAQRVAQRLLQEQGRPSVKPTESEREIAAWIGEFYLHVHQYVTQATSRAHAARLVLEELRLFMEAEAAVALRHDKCIYQSMTQQEFDAAELHTRARYLPTTSKVQTIPIHLDATDIPNENLRACNTLIVATQPHWAIQLWLRRGQPPSTPAPDPVQIAEFWDGIWLLLSGYELPEREESMQLPSLTTPEPRGFAGRKAFLDQYEKHFLPIDSILEPLREKITIDLQRTLKVDADEIDCAFSIRNPKPDHDPAPDSVRFYMTHRQLKNVLRDEDQIKPLRELLNYPYYRGEALSGWVLETGAFIYIPNYTTSGLWTRYINVAGPERQRREDQRARVEQFRSRGGELKNAFLLPVLVSHVVDNEGNLRPRADLMLSITTSKELNPATRRRIFGLVQQLSLAARTVIAAQEKYENIAKRSLIGEKVQPLTSFLSHQLSNQSNGIANAILSRNLNRDTMRSLCMGLVNDIQTVCNVASAYHTIVVNGEQLKMAYCSRTFFNEVWDRAQKEMIRINPSCEQLFARSRLEMGRPPRLNIHAPSIEFMIRNLISNAVQALDQIDDGIAKVGKIALSVAFESKKERVLICVQDNGPGMTPETAQQIKDGIRVSKRPGTNNVTKGDNGGYGWTFIRLFCEHHAGNFAIDSTLNRGTTVTITLPTRTKNAVSPRNHQ